MNLFKADYSAITHILSYPIVIMGLLFHSPWIVNAGLVLWFTSFDVLMWKWVMHGARTLLSPRIDDKGKLLFYPKENVVTVWDFARYALVKGLKPAPEPVLAYRIPQHGIFWFVLLLIGYYNDWQYSVPAFIVWITFGCDVLYHWIGRAELAAWDRRDYYAYGYWAFPFGWIRHFFYPGQYMPAYGLYIQAIAGSILSVIIAVGVL